MFKALYFVCDDTPKYFVVDIRTGEILSEFVVSEIQNKLEREIDLKEECSADGSKYFLATSPFLFGCCSTGKTEGEAIEKIRKTLGNALWARF